MNKEIIIIIGLPGSGKSSLIKQRFSDNTNYIIFDDFKACAVLDSSGFCFSKHYPEIIGQVKLGEKHIVIADIDFCNNDSYLEAKEILEWWIKNLKSKYKTRSIFLENDPEKCKKNLTRDNGRNIESRISMIEKYSQLYFPNNVVKEEDEILVVYSD